MSELLTLTNSVARNLFLERQGLSSPPRRKLDNDGLLKLITELGFVQVDSIQTVARAHHMILFARNQTYREKQLQHLLEVDNSLFENWTHDASIIPSEFYCYWKHKFRRHELALLERWRKWRREGFEEVLHDILKMVEDNGPLMARDIGSGRKKGTGWWDWHPEKTALEYHWRTGNLSISGRQGFQKIYDVCSNVIPECHLKEQVDEPAFIDWACRSALTRLGAATSGEIAAFWDLVRPKEAAEWCKGKLAAGEIIEVLVEPGGKGKPTRAFAWPAIEDRIADLPAPPDRIRALSPFDPLIRDRKRLERLFGFDYRIEVFVPAAKRKYGYYVFPLLQGQRFIGRIDMKNDKEADALRVSGLWLEPGVKPGKDRIRAMESELERQRRFIGASSFIFDPEIIEQE